MIDEFQDVLAWGTPFLSMMRQAIQAQKSVTYIFSGSAPSVLGDMVHDPNAPFYRQLHDVRVTPLGEGEAGAFLRRRFAVVDIAPEQGAVDRIYELSGGFPDYVQRLAFASYMRCIEGDKSDVTAADIESAYPDMLAQIGRDLEAQFNMATPMERDVLIALAHSKDRAGALARAIRAPMSSIPRALDRLAAKDMVEKQPDHRYRIADNVFADWIAKRYGSDLS